MNGINGFRVSVELAKLVSLNYEFTKFKLEAVAMQCQFDLTYLVLC